MVYMELQYWREAHPGHELKRIRVLACGAEEELFDAVMELEDAERKIEEVCAAVVQGVDDGVDDLRNKEEDDEVEIIRRRGRRIPCGLCTGKMDEVT